jgi:rare lipoprotein A
MGWQSSKSFGTRARGCALLLGVFALAHCSPVNSTYTEDTEQQVPKGGGRYSVGKPYTVNGQTYVPAENSRYRAEGIASWYGSDFHGGPTANGERYDMHGISAAHPTLPLPSYARVTNLDNGRSIIVRINNRGPFAHNRLIDVSVGTAKALDFHRRGTAHVRVEYVGRAPVEGSDDQMLLATLREGSPAPAPSKVMIASAKPFLPADGKDAKATERPAKTSLAKISKRKSSDEATLVTGTTRKAPATSTADAAPPRRSVVQAKSANADPQDASPAASLRDRFEALGPGSY